MILVLIFYSSTLFKSLFPNVNVDLLFENNLSRNIIEKGTILMIFCNFQNLTLPLGNGGAIYCNSNNKIISFIEYCSFTYNSVTSNDGGAIYFMGSNSDFIISKSCGFYCFTSSSKLYQFCYSQTRINSSNIFYLTTISKSSPFSGSRHYCMCIRNGDQTVKSCNMTDNIVQHISSFDLSGNSPLSIMYSTFFKNYATGSRCLNVFYSTKIIEYINFLNNTQLGTNFALLRHYSGILSLYYSVFKYNIGILFWNEIGTFTIFNSTISGSFQNTGAIILNSVFSDNTLKLVHIYTYNCFAFDPFMFSNFFGFKFRKLIIFFTVLFC